SPRSKSGERAREIQKLVFVDRGHHLEPVLVHRLRAKCTRDRTANGGYRVCVSAEVRTEQSGLLCRLCDQSQTDSQGNDVLRLVGEVLLRNLIDIQMLPPREIRMNLLNRSRDGKCLAGRSKSFSLLGGF